MECFCSGRDELSWQQEGQELRRTANRNLGRSMSIKMNYLFSNTDRFPENLSLISDEQGDILSGHERVRDQLRKEVIFRFIESKLL